MQELASERFPVRFSTTLEILIHQANVVSKCNIIKFFLGCDKEEIRQPNLGDTNKFNRYKISKIDTKTSRGFLFFSFHINNLVIWFRYIK